MTSRSESRPWLRRSMPERQTIEDPPPSLPHAFAGSVARAGDRAG